ncbi:exopolysaccharide biosynthesis polyprenyl glycosylphosphotransferase [Dysgonomonas sp. 216]|uniref:exopolysaccharide biosynthesis polyprenyl glycosylphosphotransferase n=1 Tax=Dysgonomonas sp. 216 TaxID=2302934 RepID=UPI0013D1F63F|nr:exopolysaccharide biosynthesis polyprenyl glycosylphosphotransferase [Dysgonomonas sp. 216]NDW17731.1 exopolysaccharide biosynthesis polyprenyl glycosylphosphotransferase [Dysgonomonas sp. 216]
MNLRYSKYISSVCVITDIIIVCGLFFVLYSIQLKGEFLFDGAFSTLSEYYNAFLLFILSWYLIAQKTLLYKIYRSSDLLSIAKKTIIQILYFGIVVYAFLNYHDQTTFSARYFAIYFFSLFILAILSRYIILFWLRRHRTRGGNLRHIVFIDSNSSTRMLVKLLRKRKSYGMDIKGIFLENATEDDSKDIYKFDITKLETFLKENHINMLYFSVGGELSQHLSEIQKIAYRSRIQLFYIPDAVDDLPNNLRIDYFEAIPVMANKKLPLDNVFNQVIKRIFDILFSLTVVILILSWLYPLLALFIKLDSKGPVLFLQDRNGLNGQTFKCFKFRTMKPNSEAGIVATEKNDRRITRMGRILRKTSIDELPQFLNVLLGNMSIVGPRPHMVHQDNYYNNLLPKYCIRYYVKPGITGLSQVSGLRGEIKTDEDMEKRALTDSYYVQKWSLMLDVLVVFKTVYYMVVGDKQAI